MNMKTSRAALALCIALGSGSVHALDLSPNDYIHLPDGSIVLVNYAYYVKGDSFVDTNGNRVPNSGEELAYGVARALYYGSTGGVLWATQAILPYGKVVNAHIGGVDLPTASGIGDLTLSGAFWALYSTEPTGTILGFSTYLMLPTGAYDPFKASIGSGAVSLTEQIGLSQGLGSGFVLDAGADASVHFGHTNDGIFVKQYPTYQLQSYLRYNFTPTTTMSFGCSATFGGRTTFDGIDAQSRSTEYQLRLFATTFVAPTVQLQGMLGRDVSVKGTFRQNFVSQVRVAFLF